MRIATTRLLAPLSVILLGVLAGCGGAGGGGAGGGSAGGGEEAAIGTIRTAPPETTAPELPPVEPVTSADCPYLAADDVSRLNGEPVTDVRIDQSVDPAACFFYSADGRVQLTTTVYAVRSPERAAELVEESAPGGESEPASAEGGWTGGSTEGPAGALVVLSRGPQVLAVQSTQEESITVQRIAELVAPRIAD